MMHAAVRAVLEEPALLFLLSFLLFLLLLRKTRPPEPAVRRFAILSGGVCALVFLALGILNLSRPGFIWHDEPGILSIAASYLHGQPLYHSRSDPALYSLLYGPSTYLVYLPFLTATDHPLPLIRWFGLAIYLANGAALYLLLRGKASTSTSLALLILPLAILLSSASHAFGIRGDPILLLCLSLGLLSIRLSAWPAAALLCGLAGGIAVDFKLTVAPAVLLLFALLSRRHGRRALLLSSATALLVAAIPFVLPMVSLKNYIGWLLLSSRQGLDPVLLKSNLLLAALMLAPGVFLRLSARRDPSPPPPRKDSLLLAALFLTALACCVLTGAKNGAGTWHLWPMLPFAAIWSAHEATRKSGTSIPAALSAATGLTVPTGPTVLAIAFAACIVTFRLAYRDLPIVHPKDIAAQRVAEHGAQDELARIVRNNPAQNVEMAYGRDVGDDRSSLRFELPLEKQDYFLDEDALVELLKAGLSPSPALTSRILGCANLWLVPHGDAPFQTLRKGVLPDTATPFLFPDIIRLHFAETHTLQAKGTYYDLWACPAEASASSPSHHRM